EVGAGGKPAVEAKPADPQKAGANPREREIVGSQVLAAISPSRADDIRGHQAGDACIQMHHRATREINQAIGAEEAAAPDPMRNWHVHNEQPERTKQKERGEAE